MKRCACIDTLYTEIPFEDRFAAAKRDGFESVEFWDWRIRDLKKVRAAAEAAGIAISGFNGDNDFSLVDPEQEKPYLEALKASLEAAQAVGAETVTIHSNALGDGGVVVNHYDELSDTVKLCSMYRTLTESVKLAEAYKIRMNLEALNIKVDHVGNFLQTTQMAAEVTRLIDSPYLMVLFDAYHM
ncbi:MAG: TIM barrel protein, partial [Mitsuokella jalaludinii]|nr:TIM barrel protein [Mitsuokella jalaludinii]